MTRIDMPRPLGVVGGREIEQVVVKPKTTASVRESFRELAAMTPPHDLEHRFEQGSASRSFAARDDERLCVVAT